MPSKAWDEIINVHCPPSHHLPPTPLLLFQRQRRGVGQELIDDQWRQPLHDGSAAVGGEGQEEDAITPVHEVVGLPVQARYSSQSLLSLWRFHLSRSLGSALDAIVVIPPPEQPQSWNQRPVVAVAVGGERCQERGWSMGL